MTANLSRHLALVWMAEEDRKALVDRVPHRADLLAVLGLPADSEVVDWKRDFRRQAVLAVVQSEEFPVTFIGDDIPEFKTLGIHHRTRGPKA